MIDIEKAIKWFENRKGKVSYSMENRNGPNSYDCSSSIFLSGGEKRVYPQVMDIQEFLLMKTTLFTVIIQLMGFLLIIMTNYGFM